MVVPLINLNETYDIISISFKKDWDSGYNVDDNRGGKQFIGRLLCYWPSCRVIH